MYYNTSDFINNHFLNFHFCFYSLYCFSLLQSPAEEIELQLTGAEKKALEAAAYTTTEDIADDDDFETIKKGQYKINSAIWLNIR